MIILIPVLGLAGVYGYYKSIVAEQPSGRSGDVNVFSGTGGIPYTCAYNTPAAQVPLGMVRLGPDTASIITNMRALNSSGYYYGDNKIIGFSHTRIVGADALEGGHFRVFPTSDARVERDRAALAVADVTKGPFYRFRHRDEDAYPGYYSVKLAKGEITARLTATPRVGVHEYVFKATAGRLHILFDVTSVLGEKPKAEGEFRILPEARELEGKATTSGTFSGRYGGITVYFVARFDQPFAEYCVWQDGAVTPGRAEATGKRAGADLVFSEEASKIQLQVAISYVSIENARANLEAEAAGKSFEQVASLAFSAWQTRLASIRVDGGTAEQRRVFYTALYRAFQMPTTFSDVNGQYTGFDRNVHHADGFTYYTDFSLWDTFRTVHPLYNLIARSEQRDMMRSLVEMAKAGGCLPRWPSGCGYTNCMFGTPADIAVTEAYLKGVRDFDIQTAYRAMRQTALSGKPESSRFGGRNALAEYLQYGYLPSDKTNKTVSATMEYAWADHALSLLAAELGHHDDAAQFAKGAQSWKNLWNPETQFFMPRDSSGAFAAEFKPLKLSYLDPGSRYTRHYVEGSAMQWRWGVPFDMEGLLATFKSRDYFVSELQTYFENSTGGKCEWNPGGYYWQGNEPYFHAAYLFNAAGRPDLTQKWVRWIINTKYGDDYVGLDGNDDGGTLSAWYVWSALGLYPIAGTTRYELGAPLFEKARVTLNSGKELIIIADNYGPENIYVTQAALNGAPLEKTSIAHDQIASGGTLRFTMSPTPLEN